MHRRPRLALALAAVALLLACAAGVEVSPLPAATHAACGDLPWPATVGGQRTASVSEPGPDRAAWGSPAIIARCGGAALAPTTVQCLVVDDVGWIPQELSDGTRFTTFGTDPSLEVLVPGEYSPESLLLPAFTDAARRLPRNGLECR